MATLKVYDNQTDYNSKMIPEFVRVALGLPRHNQQGDLYVVAATKKAAAERLTELGIRTEPRGLRVGMGNDLDTLREMGLLDESGTVLATPMTGHHGAGVVVQVTAHGEAITVAEEDGLEPGSYRRRYRRVG